MKHLSFTGRHGTAHITKEGAMLKHALLALLALGSLTFAITPNLAAEETAAPAPTEEAAPAAKKPLQRHSLTLILMILRPSGRYRMPLPKATCST